LYYYVNGCPSSNVGWDSEFPISALSFYSVENISDTTIDKTRISYFDIFDENGEYTSPDFTIIKGLNKVNIILKGGQSRSFVFDALETMSGIIELSSFLEVTIFPVPIRDNTFSINFQATATLDFTYELFDFTGTRLHKMDYSIIKDHNEDHVISSNTTIPAGILLNKLTFIDGSSISITTLKEN